jgi:hypothetical protein
MSTLGLVHHALTQGLVSVWIFSLRVAVNGLSVVWLLIVRACTLAGHFSASVHWIFVIVLVRRSNPWARLTSVLVTSLGVDRTFAVIISCQRAGVRGRDVARVARVITFVKVLCRFMQLLLREKPDRS